MSAPEQAEFTPEGVVEFRPTQTCVKCGATGLNYERRGSCVILVRNRKRHVCRRGHDLSGIVGFKEP